LSEIRATTISDAAGTGPITLTKQSAAKAWVNFNGTGTASIRDSVNVASLTDNGTGIYTLTYTSSMSSTSSHVPNANCEESVNGYNRSATVTSSSTAHTDCRFFNTGTNVLFDGEYGYVTTHGDLA